MSEERKVSPWFQAVMVTPPRICGRRLRPYSIGHEMILSEIASPYVCGGEATARDTMLALQVCSRTVDDCREWLRSGGPSSRRLEWWAMRWARHMATAGESFRVYLADYGNLPAIVQTGEGERARLAGSPWWHMVRIMCEHFAPLIAQYPTVWDVPKPIAICAVDCWAESTGNATLASENEATILSVVQQAQDLMAAGKHAEAAKLFERAELMAAGMRIE